MAEFGADCSLRNSSGLLVHVLPSSDESCCDLDTVSGVPYLQANQLQTTYRSWQKRKSLPAFQFTTRQIYAQLSLGAALHKIIVLPHSHTQDTTAL